MLSPWLSFLVPAFIAAVLLILPGLVVNLCLGATGFDVLGLAPLSSLGVLAIGTLLVPTVQSRWGLGAVALATVAVAVLAIVGRLAVIWLSTRQRPIWSVVRDQERAQSRWWKLRRRTLWWFAAAAFAAALVGANFVLGVRDPGLPSQTVDAGFHYNAALSVIWSGLPDGGHVGAASGAAVTAWYPPLWHDLTALVSQTAGVNVAVGANAVGWAIGGVVWPLSMVWLCSRILPHARVITTLAIGLCCGAIGLFPYLLLSFGVLWPNVLSLAAMPAAIALGLMILRLMPRRPQADDDIFPSGRSADGATLDAAELAAVGRKDPVGPELSWWTIVYVLFIGSIGLFFAHPGAVFALGIWAGIGAIMLSVRLVQWARRQGRRQLRRSLLGLAGGWAVALGLWFAMDLVPALKSVRDFNWPEFETMNQAMGEAVTLSTNITHAHWAFGVAAIWGFLRLMKLPRLRWLVFSHAFLLFLYMLDAGSGSWLSRQLTGFWYNDPQRVAALIPLTAVPLAAVGITAAADTLGRFIGRMSAEVWGRVLSPRRALGAACVLMAVVPAVIYPNQGIGEGAGILQDRYTNLHGFNHLVTADEQEMFTKLGKQIPAGTTVLGSPFTGAQFSSIWSGHPVVIPHITSNPKPDVALVQRQFKEFTTNPEVCAAVKRLKIGAVVEDYDTFWPTDSRQKNYLGLVDLVGTPGLTPIGYGESSVAYRVGDCHA
ncbi:DUF6541 family protein [Oryzihumus leptocrescens]|uniref:Uncharacterized protein n=1 Tax=Oryzihumus leptocrescens TaxID=297536 RepID=A0A542ZGA5_9MICO|nr:DUF6541 family protein [Oryzihumus leptocrescens]TQL59362.1 hypothetical protein FB474_0716 [Oryzihumus leptocrescens]